MLGVALLVLTAGLVESYDRHGDGYIHQYGGCRPWAGGRLCPLVSLNYPEPSPSNVKYTWNQGTASYEGDKPAVKITCYDFRLPQTADGQCGEGALKIQDGSSVEYLCGHRAPFSWTSKTDEISVTLEQGANPIFFNCSMGTILLSSTKPVENEYLTWKSEEVDSDEHGLVPGRRSTSCRCGWANKVTSRIVNGTEAGINEFPFVAVLVIKRSRQHICTSSIITKRHIITASHCTYRYTLKERPLAVVVGEHRLNEKNESPYTVMIDVEKINQHPDYIPAIQHNDIAILDLAKDIVFSQFVGPACFPTGLLSIDKQYVKIMGWGDTEYGVQHSDVLNKADVRVVPRDQCAKIYREFVSENDTSKLCLFAKHKSSCSGDSGGPGVWLDPDTNRYTLIGAFSFFTVPCGTDRPTVHSNVPHYISWIRKHIQDYGQGEVCTKI